MLYSPVILFRNIAHEDEKCIDIKNYFRIVKKYGATTVSSISSLLK